MLQVFPVATEGKPHFWDDWHQPRGTPANPRLHQGNDIFATSGTAVLAPDDGALSFYTDPLGGPAFTLKAPDGTGYYGAHLSGYEGSPRHVTAGEVVGYVGTGGDAAGTPPHLHFQMSIGGVTVDPYPYLMRAPRRATPSKGASSDGWLLVGVTAVFVGAVVWAVRRR